MAGMESIDTRPGCSPQNGSANLRPDYFDLATPGPPDGDIRTYCDIAKANAFSSSYDGPPLPVLVAFGREALHLYRTVRACNLERSFEELGGLLIRSLCNQEPDEPGCKWQEVLFKFGPKAFLQADNGTIFAYSDTPLEARRLALEFSKKYGLPPKPPDSGTFHLIRHQGIEIATEAVTLEAHSMLPDSTLDLHFGGGFSAWNRGFSMELHESKYGLTIFEGSPGTGKTSYLRHLIGVLNDTHRFYFVPTAVMRVLSEPDFIGFWSRERREYQERKFVVIIEDAEAALLTRGMDNREQVSAILNLTDGMLADFLRLQIICTINCSSTDIDPALLRPGRLLCHRYFPRLNYAEANRLAKHLGKALPTSRDYSLAEIYNSESRISGAERIRAMGFAG